MSINEQLMPVMQNGNQKTLPVDPVMTTTSNSGWGFLDQLGGAVVGSLPSVLDNLTKRNNDPVAPDVQPDQTAVHGDAALTKNDEQNFLEKNWKMLGGGLIAVLGLVYIASRK